MRVIISLPQCHVESRSIYSFLVPNHDRQVATRGSETPIDEQPNSVTLLSQLGNYGDSCSMAFFLAIPMMDSLFFFQVEGGNLGLFENLIRITG